MASLLVDTTHVQPVAGQGATGYLSLVADPVHAQHEPLAHSIHAVCDLNLGALKLERSTVTGNGGRSARVLPVLRIGPEVVRACIGKLDVGRMRIARRPQHKDQRH